MDQQLNQPYYLKKLRDEFEARTARRPDYSLRAYANFLEVEAPSLSGVLKGARRLAKSKVAKVADKLNLSPEEKDLFIKSNRSDSEVTKQPSAVVNRYQLDSETHFRIIAEWEHYAILSLVETVDFKPHSKWIAERLGISDLRAKICVENLLVAGLISTQGESIVLTHQGLQTTEDAPSKALQRARKQDLEMALNSIDEISVDLRDLSSCTMTLNTEDLQELKMMIRDFRNRFMTQAEMKKGKEIYKLAVQLFPLTKIGSPNESI